MVVLVLHHALPKQGIADDLAVADRHSERNALAQIPKFVCEARR